VYLIQDSKFRYVNPALARIFGYDREELEGGMGPADLAYPEDWPKVAEFIRRRVEGEVESAHYTFRAVRKDGRLIQCEVLGQRVEFEGLPGVVGTLLDITEREQAQRELIESEALFRGLAEKSPNAIYINQRGKVVYANSATVELMGYSQAEFTDPGFNFLKLIAPESLDAVRSYFRQHQQGTDLPPYECRLLTRDGRALDSIIATRLISFEGEFAILGIVTDVTQRKEAERELQRLLEEEQQHRKLAEAVARVGLSLTAQLELVDLLDLISKASTEVFGVSSAFVWMLEGDELVGFAGHGMGRREFLGRRLPMADPDSLAPMVVREARPIFVNRALFSKPVNQALIQLFGAQAILGVPLVRAGRVEGVLILLDSEDPDRFSEKDLETGMVLGNQMALAIESAQLVHRDRRRLQQLTALIQASTVISSTLDLDAILTRVAEEMCTAVDATSAYICTYDPENKTSTVVAEYYAQAAVERESDLGHTYDLEAEFPGTVEGLEIGNPLLAQVEDPTLSESERRHMRHYKGKTTLTIPFESGGRVRAFAELWESRAPRQFTEDEVELCLAIGRQSAIALENGRLYQQAQADLAERWRAEKELSGAVAQLEVALERAERLAATEEALRDSAAALSSTLDLSELLDRILENVGRVVPSDTVDIMLLEEQPTGDMLVGARGRGYGERGQEGWLENLRLPIQSVPNFRRIAQTGSPYAIPEVKKAPEWVDIPETRWIQSYAAAPLRTRGKIIGILNLCSETPGFYTQAHANLLLAFADQAAAAIENAKLFSQANQELQERLRAEQELRRLSEFNESILKEMADGVVVQDREGTFTYVNSAAAALFGVTPEEMLGQHWTRFITPETQRLVEAADARRREGVSDRYEVQLLRGDGTHLPVLVSGRPRSERGEFAGTIAVFTDITERKRAEEAERAFLRTKEEFLLSASHSLRTPLHTLMGFLELLAAGKVEDPEQHQDFLARALSDARHLADLVQDVLGTAQLEAGSVQLDLQVLRPVELLAETLASLQGLARDKDIELTWSVGEIPEGLRADRARLRQALGNLVENAIHYSEPGTIVRVEAAARGTGMEIRVIDHGPGISPADQATMFEKPYLRPTDRPGSRGGIGLGLYLAHTIAEAHGGRVQVESEVGKGSTFTIIIPG
jgi:PAS domain S-box-containing protein